MNNIHLSSLEGGIPGRHALSRVAVWLGLGCLLFLAKPAGAAVLSWQGLGSSGNWSDRFNWNGVNTPDNGDTLFFPAGQPRLANTNDISSLTLNAIVFWGATGGYAVYGNPFTLTNSIQATNAAGVNTLYNNVTLASQDIALTAGSGATLTLSGVLSGSVGGFTKIGSGTLSLAGSSANSYHGNTFVNQGVMLLGKLAAVNYGTLTIGDGWGGANADIVRETVDDCITGGYGGVRIVIKSSGLLDLNNHLDYIGPIELDGGNIASGATGLLDVAPPVVSYRSAATNGFPTISGKMSLSMNTTFGITNYVDVTANISGSGGLTKNGPETLTLSSSNSYAGLTVVQGGWLRLQNAWALGTTAQGTVVSNGASLVLNGTFGITNEPLTLNGVGEASDWGALDSEVSGTSLWVGPITLNADSTLSPWPASARLRIIGPISGPGGITKIGSGTVELAGTTANSFTGLTRVNTGTLELNKTVFDGAIPGNLEISGTVRLLNVNQITNTSDVTINASGLLAIAAAYEGIDTISGSGAVALSPGYLVVGYGNGSSTFSGVISGTTNLTKAGTGTITLEGNNTYSGQTIVSVGTLRINGSQPQSVVSVGSSGTLGGYGTVGTIVASGAVSPGASPGMLTCSNMTFSSGGDFLVELTGLVPGADHDQLKVRGTNNLANAILQVTPAFAHPVRMGDQFVILDNDGTEAITGTFSGLTNNATFAAGEFTFRINYNSGTGNDVVLTVVSVPMGHGGTTVATGNGNHAIDPNECNLLGLLLTNAAATPLTGIHATLSTTESKVLITQPYADYPDVPTGGSRTNVTPFQLTTLPGFVCGADIHLELAVQSASHGAFVVPMVVHSGGPSSSPLRYDVNSITNIPDVGTIESTNLVAGFTGPLTKVAVSLWLTHSFDADLSLSLVSPAGAVVELTSGNGVGANFGNGCSPDSLRTTFDEAASTSILAGTPPFVGTFRPEASLAAFVGGSANGNWRLRVTDNNGGTLGALRCWSLFLYPVDCSPGSGVCDVCLPAINGAISAGDPLQTSRVARNLTVASCASPKLWPGPYGSTYRYNVYGFTNTTGADACVTVELQSSADLQAVAYLNSFDPANIATGYLGDAGDSTADVGFNVGPTAFSCTVPAGATLIVTVNEVAAGSATLPYTLSISGLPCPPPTLEITPTDTVGKVRLHWPTWAGDYQLGSAPSLFDPAWTPYPNEPIVGGGRYHVTNAITGTNTFYRLYK